MNMLNSSSSVVVSSLFSWITDLDDCTSATVSLIYQLCLVQMRTTLKQTNSGGSLMNLPHQQVLSYGTCLVLLALFSAV